MGGIQQSSVTHADGYRTMPLRTGYERVILSRVNEDFGLVAEQDGEVVEITETSLMIRYKDGSEHAFDLGRRFGQAAGAVYPHELKSNVKPGQKFKAGHALFYNAQYFEPDPLDSSVVVWKSGVPCRVAFLESPETHEDASSISQSLAEKLNTQITKVRDITVSFDQSVHRLVEVGDRVEVDSILCSIEDAITAGTGLFDETSLDTLKLISANAPKAKMRGVVEKVEVFYHGEFDDMSESLQQLARRSDLLRKRQAKRTMRNYTSGRVDGALRIKGNPLAFGNAVIRIHISGDVGASSGDLNKVYY